MWCSSIWRSEDNLVEFIIFLNFKWILGIKLRLSGLHIQMPLSTELSHRPPSVLLTKINKIQRSVVKTKESAYMYTCTHINTHVCTYMYKWSFNSGHQQMWSFHLYDLCLNFFFILLVENNSHFKCLSETVICLI